MDLERLCTVMEKEKWNQIQAVMERESHSLIIPGEGSVFLPALRAMLPIHQQTFVKFNVIYCQHKEPTDILHSQIFLQAEAAGPIFLFFHLLSLDVQFNELPSCVLNRPKGWCNISFWKVARSLRRSDPEITINMMRKRKQGKKKGHILLRIFRARNANCINNPCSGEIGALVFLWLVQRDGKPAIPLPMKNEQEKPIREHKSCLMERPQDEK